MALVFDGTNGLTVPTWTTTTRPIGPAVGQMGYNTTIGQFDIYTANGWVAVLNTTSTTNKPSYAGSALQTVGATLNTFGSTTSSTYVAVSGLSVAITPASTSNKILIRGHVWISGSSQNGMYGAVFRDASILSGAVGNASQSNAIINGGSGTVRASGGFIPHAGFLTYQATPIYFEFLDSPSSTASLTYQIYVRVGGGGTLYYNYQSNTSTNPDFGYFASTITAQEIAA